MFECSSPEMPDEVFCHLAFTIFAFHEPRQLLGANSVLAVIVKMERENKVENYSVYKDTLYCRCSQERCPKHVVPPAAIPMSWSIFTHRRYVATWGFLRT